MDLDGPGLLVAPGLPPPPCGETPGAGLSGEPRVLGPDRR